MADAFSGSAVSKNLTTLYEYKPSKNYKGTSTDVFDGSLADFGAMVISANDAPTRTFVEKTDNKGKVVWETDEDGNFVFVTEDGSFVDPWDDDSLKQYVVTVQSVKPNTELKLVFETNEDGTEGDTVASQNIEEIELYVKRISEEKQE